MVKLVFLALKFTIKDSIRTDLEIFLVHIWLYYVIQKGGKQKNT